MKRYSLKTFFSLTLGAIVYTFVFQMFYNWMRYDVLFPSTLWITLRSILFNSIPFWILINSNYLIIWYYPHNGRTWKSYGVLFLISVSVLVIMNSVIYLSGIKVEWAGTAFSELLIFIGMAAIYYERVSRIAIRQQALAKQEILQYQYEALKSQVNPHFLFNSFNILYSFLPPELTAAREYVLNLSYIYRYNMNHGNNPHVTLKEEIDFLLAYIKILRIRYNDNFSVEIHDAEKYEDSLIIPYTLQLLVENVTKHNVISSSYPMTVKIIADSEGVTVTNPIRAKEADVSTHFGLKYLKSLYKCHDRLISVSSDSNTYTSFIPYLQQK